ncbi:MAG TPA: YtxH domain-containing protein [Candidatus Paceibacterota bacterium]
MKKSLGSGLLGAAIGAGIAYYLYGTDSGKAKRKEITKMAKNAKNKVADKADEVSEAASELYENISESMREKYGDLTERDPKKVKELAGRIKEHWADIKKDIHDTLSE